MWSQLQDLTRDVSADAEQVGVIRAAAGELYGVAPIDPVTYGIATALLVVVTLFASGLPARGVTRIDASGTLRDH